MVETDSCHYRSIKVSMTYNLARIFETQHKFQKAETLYKDILKKHPSYIDCILILPTNLIFSIFLFYFDVVLNMTGYLRLGCMARDCNHIFEASHWFKEALNVDNNHADAWSLLGNLHLAKKELGAAQKKFEHILEVCI